MDIVVSSLGLTLIWQLPIMAKLDYCVQILRQARWTAVRLKEQAVSTGDLGPGHAISLCFTNFIGDIGVRIDTCETKK